MADDKKHVGDTTNKAQYRIKSATISSDRFASKKVDNIVEITLFEHIDRPYVSGYMVMADTTDFVDTVGSYGMSGTERLKLVCETTQNTGDAPNTKVSFTRNLVITGIETSVKSAEVGSQSTVVFSLIDEWVIASQARKISRSFKHKKFLEKEVYALITECGVGVRPRHKESVQENIKGIIPYMHPLKAAEWIMRRLCTKSGMPFFMYSTIWEDAVSLSSLDWHFEQAPFNKRPFHYAPATSDKIEYEAGMEAKSFNVKTMRASKQQNQFKMLSNAGTGVNYGVTNLNGTEQYPAHIDFRHAHAMEARGKLSGAGVIKGQQNVYDESFSIKGVGPMHNPLVNNAQIHQINSENIYTTEWKSYHYEPKWALYKSKVHNNQILNMLWKNAYEVTVDGAQLFKNKKGVGDIVNIQIISDHTDLDNAPKKADELRSGHFLILGTRHTLQTNVKHEVVLTVSKLNKGPNELG